MKDSRDTMPAGKTYTIRASGFLIPCKIMSYFHQEQIRLVCKKKVLGEAKLGISCFDDFFFKGAAVSLTLEIVHTSFILKLLF